MTFAFAFIIAAAVLGATGRYGAESRPGFDERPESTRFGALR